MAQPSPAPDGLAPQHQTDISRRLAVGLGAAPYVISAAIAIAIACLILGVRPHLLSIPFAYKDDANFFAMLVKQLIEEGALQHNARLGAPGSLIFYDFPLGNGIAHWAALKLLSVVAGDWVRTLNGYYLLSFGACAATALFALRRLGLSTSGALVTAILFALLPYHFMRGESHLILAAYWPIPLVILLIVRLALGERLLVLGGSLGDRSTLFSIAVCALIASADLYSACFACFFFLVAGIAAAVRLRQRWPLVSASSLIAVIVLVGFLDQLPTVFYWIQHGLNSHVCRRGAWEAEIYGFKPAQLFLPILGHRVALLAELKRFYNATSPTVNENDSAALGLAAAAGLAVLITTFPFVRRRGTRLEVFGLLALSGLALGCLGGIGSLIAYFLTPALRGYNRVSIYLGFFGLAAMGLGLDRLFARLSVSQWLRKILFALLLFLGVLEQTSPLYRIPFDKIGRSFASDHAFVEEMEKTLPPGSLIYQLPSLSFPEAPSPHRMAAYDLFRGYLHSRLLRWSYGGMSGRDADWWRLTIDDLPLPRRLLSLCHAGFGGIYLDRFGYAPDDPTEKQLQEQVGPPRLSPDQRLAFFDLRGSCEQLLHVLPEAQRRALRVRVLDDPKAIFPASTQPFWNDGHVLPEPGGSVDVVTSTRLRVGGQWLHTAGWAWDPRSKEAAKRVAIVLDQQTVLAIRETNIVREDVYQAHQIPSLRRSGWEAILRPAQLGKGRHRLDFYAMLDDGAFARLSLGTSGYAVFQIK